MNHAIKSLLGAATLALAPIGANATTIVAENGSYDILSDDLFLGVVTAEGGAGSYAINFFSTVDQVEAKTEASVTMRVLGTFEDLSVSWVRDGVVLATTELQVGLTNLSTLLSDDDLGQNLVFSWTDSTASVGFDFDVTATPFGDIGGEVPIPAAGLLFAPLAVAGAGALRRRKKA